MVVMDLVLYHPVQRSKPPLEILGFLKENLKRTRVGEESSLEA